MAEVLCEKVSYFVHKVNNSTPNRSTNINILSYRLKNKSKLFYYYYFRCPNDTVLTFTIHITALLADIRTYRSV